MAKHEYGQYEIGGVYIRMTTAQATRWNHGETTSSDLDRIYVAITEPQNQARYISLRRATNCRLEPTISQMLDGMPANLVRESAK